MTQVSQSLERGQQLTKADSTGQNKAEGNADYE